MSSSNNNEVISTAKPHTIKKFELISKYVNDWQYKLLGYSDCKQLIFVDCMCNSGEYTDIGGNTVPGTAVRVAKVLRDASFQYSQKRIHLFFNDIDSRKIEHLMSILPKETENFRIHYLNKDASDFLNELGKKIMGLKHTHTLLIYDPYKAAIDWEAIMPFFNTWGEVILNHMVSDAIRTVGFEEKTNSLKPDTVKRLESTYNTDFISILPYGNDRSAYEKRIEEIMGGMRKNRKEAFIAAFPFFNRTNSLVYNLIHYTNNIKGFTLFKKTAWQVFGGKSSDKNTHGSENQLTLSLSDSEALSTVVDEECYYIKDIAEFLQKNFTGQQDVPKQSLWELLERHPVFPTDGFKDQIINELKAYYGAKVSRSTVSFKGRINQ